MPISWKEVIPIIMNKVEKFEPESILDIGIGFGKYGLLLRESLELPFERYNKETWKLRIDGVEAFKNYQNPIHEYAYNQVIYENILDVVDKLPSYDVILMIDVLEHFEKEVGVSLLKSFIKLTNKAIIISTPQYPDLQEEYLGNKYEAHKSRWTNLDLQDFDFTFELIPIANNFAQIFVIYPSKVNPSDILVDDISLVSLPSENKSLTIGYFLPHQNLTGGLKMLLEQMKHLKKKGHKVIALYRGNREEKVLPNWFDLTVDKEILVPKNESYLSYIDNCDIGIAGWVEQIPELSNANIPILYWEQGNEWLFGENLTHELRTYLKYCYSKQVNLASVSPLISKILDIRYNKKSVVIPNGIDVDFYYPDNLPNENIILLVGNPLLRFKGFDTAIRTLIRIWKSGYHFKVKWVCQDHPKLDDVPFPFPIEYIVSPSQYELADLYRKSDIFLFTSWYEGFGMPPLEAMASGVPVVSTRCGGVEFYAKDKINAILTEPGDINGLSEGVIYLLDHKEERKKLSENGRKTALKFNFSNMITTLEQYLIYLVENN